MGKSVEKILKKYNVSTKTITDSINSRKNVDLIKSLNADLILIIAGNQIIKQEVLDSTKYGVFNIHSSLLPNYKGLMPTFWVLKNNEQKTGVTLYQLTEGIDNGPIISSKDFVIPKNMPQSELIKKLKILANDLVIDSIELVRNKENYKECIGGSYFKFPTNENVKEFKNNNKRFY